jgi:multidrug efflux system membrane fusion protein
MLRKSVLTYLSNHGAFLRAGLLSALLTTSLPACDKPVPKAPQVVPVEVAVARQAEVPIIIKAVGTVEPLQKVSIRAQVSGFLQEVAFTEGDAVTEGQTLFQIDSKTFEAARAQVKAQVQQAEIQAKNARRDLERGDTLFKKQMISAEEHDRLATAADALDATVNVQKAALKTTSLNVEYCRIQAPISGRAGQLLVHKGDLIRANDTVLVQLNQVAPITVKYSIPEKEIGNVRTSLTSGEVPVTATLSTDNKETVSGRMTFVDNAVDAATGSIMLKAEFANTDEKLWPGQFVQVSATLGFEKDAVVVPFQAVQSGQGGSYAFVVTADGLAEMRKVQTGRIVDGNIVIADGIKAGETVVTDGQIRLGNKTQVEIKTDAGKTTK